MLRIALALSYDISPTMEFYSEEQTTNDEEGVVEMVT